MLSFGEFVALHLVAWSTRAWKALSTESDVYTELKTSIADKLTDWEGCHKNDLGQPSLAVWMEKETKVQKGQVTTAFERDTGRVLVYQATVARAARLLANCATYMIFDDHEITDDWNQSKQWRNRVVSRPLGRAILRNGMMAYTVCQAWGNDPRAFTRADKSIFDPLGGVPEPAATSPIWALEKTAAGQPEKLTNNGSLLKGIHDALVGTAAAPAGDLKVLDKLLGLTDPDTSGGADDKAVFHYALDGPKHRVVAIDTRTRRSFRGEGPAPPNLLGSSLDSQLPKGPLQGDRELLVAVVPVPVLGPTLIHDIVQPLSALIQDLTTTLHGRQEASPCAPGRPLTGAERRDIEGWNGDEPAMEKFLERLSTYRSVVVLSGDVHFASSVSLDYWAAGATPVARIVQLTSSGVRNEGPAILRPLVRALPFGQGLLRGEPQERLGWKETAAIDLPAGSHIAPGRRARMLRTPALVPAGGWPAGSTVTAGPDWRWRACVLRDERTHDELPVSYPFQDPVAEFDPNEPLESFARICGPSCRCRAGSQGPGPGRRVHAELRHGLVPHRRRQAARPPDALLRGVARICPRRAEHRPRGRAPAARGRRRAEARDRRLMAEPTKRRSPSGSASSAGSSDALNGSRTSARTRSSPGPCSRTSASPRRRPMTPPEKIPKDKMGTIDGYLMQVDPDQLALVETLTAYQDIYESSRVFYESLKDDDITAWELFWLITQVWVNERLRVRNPAGVCRPQRASA